MDSSRTENDLFSMALSPDAGTTYRLSRAVATAFPGAGVLEVKDGFDLAEFERRGRCETRRRTIPQAQVLTGWRRGWGLWHSVETGVFDVTWEGEDLVVVVAEWPESYRTQSRSWIVARDRTLAQRFAAAVCELCNEPHEAVLAFRGGCWTKDREIYREIQRSSFDDLVLAGELLREIREDFTTFLGAKDLYAQYGVPWKRGVLFLGPPGNGKTHCLRAVVKMLGVPCLYVQSFKAQYSTEDASIAAVFDRAREVTPCCLVFEDLDALITPKNRSTFLNQLDGFANASGMLTLATTNHPESLDPAIIDRPSRFDRKYHFSLPAAPERARYVAGWRERLDAAMRISDPEIDTLVGATDGFSFAYLKELFLSAMIRWMKDQTPGAMYMVLEGQLAVLREQMRTDPAPTPRAPVEADAEDGDD
jgi:AAA+ superfamily predicted ATPase